MLTDIIIRTFQKEDLETVLQLFYETVHTVNARDYNELQLQAWAPKRLDRERWLQSLEKNICYVAEYRGVIVGFGDYNDEYYIDRLFTHKDYQGKGVASYILQKLEKEAVNLGHGDIYTEASITAKSFFERKGFICIKEQKKQHNGQIFINYVMKK
ncbi:TPA: GNAT family N-acetyltransferase [Bacillus toyonensis]|uniref:GNAT family N-acetyltransferase n=1 Tax=Bacillus cereus group TaxID=86661 RepID=UPI00028A5945|nr:GNAT family N-acetyltransferase [Bacillus toyonensis]AFU14315.1 Acetyltransferase [Bacillus thuringiensis MC28]OTW83140.1 GNAT family N-acetyltransferase [Bacillus thuringiensis serovar cameroun]OTX07725.1 GNAT family N-acetyltransferase [Bacillus thuringiensis serovar seoulensis]QPW47422.1 GNAT family N-acetyltransferase [Bacillus thuringiensis]MCA1045427.1 GNAT family N-acetyltransferase [Bacillus toyonensis]